MFAKESHTPTAAPYLTHPRDPMCKHRDNGKLIEVHAIACCFGHEGLAQASLVKYMIKRTGTKDSIPFEHLTLNKPATTGRITDRVEVKLDLTSDQ